MTILMPSWYYEKRDFKKSPSILDGLDWEQESRYRREGARFIINVGTKMGLRYDTMATGVVYFHRFYMFHSFRTFPRYVTACCCLFLAGKVEETPKKCKDIIRIARTFLRDSQFAQFGDDPKEEVMTLERILLQTIKFDLQVDHPYGHLLKYAKCLKGDKAKLQNMVQMAWTFINDSLCTTLCLQWEPEVIAIALMYLAGKLSKFEVIDWAGRTSKHLHWWDVFVEGMSIELLEDICHQVLDLYSTPFPNNTIESPDSPPATPPTKSTRKVSQPPSPAETSTSPAQIKPKETPIGQPIPRLEPGETKRKVAQTELRKEPSSENKVPRITEGKSIPIITTSPPKPVVTLSQISDNKTPSPAPPLEAVTRNSKPTPEAQKVTINDAVYRTNVIASNQPAFPPSSSYVAPTPTDASLKLSHPPPVPVTSYPPTIPPTNVVYTPSNAPYYPDSQHYPMSQTPTQMFNTRPTHFSHPPPPVHPGGPPPPVIPPPTQYTDHSQQSIYPPLPSTSSMPPFNTHYPPPRQQPPMGLLNTPLPPPGPMPGVPPHGPPPPHSQNMPPTGLLRPMHPGPSRSRTENIYAPRTNIDPYNQHQENRTGRMQPEHMRMKSDYSLQRNYEPDRNERNHYNRGVEEGEYDMSYEGYDYNNDGYSHGLPTNQYIQEYDKPNLQQPPPPSSRRYSLENQMHRKPRGPPPPQSMSGNVSQHPGTPTGIPP